MAKDTEHSVREWRETITSSGLRMTTSGLMPSLSDLQNGSVNVAAGSAHAHGSRLAYRLTNSSATGRSEATAADDSQPSGSSDGASQPPPCRARILSLICWKPGGRPKCGSDAAVPATMATP